MTNTWENGCLKWEDYNIVFVKISYLEIQLVTNYNVTMKRFSKPVTDRIYLKIQKFWLAEFKVVAV
jgi:hypothetical protein